MTARVLLSVVMLCLSVFTPAAASAGLAAPEATTILVNTLADELNANGNCSLREAIRAANLDQAVDACAAGNGADTIVLQNGVTYTLTRAGADDTAILGDLDITDDVTIVGSNAIIDANGVNIYHGVSRDTLRPELLRLAPGNNSIRVSENPPANNQVSLTYRPRWYI